MGEQKEKGLYHNFSRKDLQGLCKKYGLPANKSNSEMATSLILYLEKKNISSRTVWEVIRSDPYFSGLSELQSGVSMNTTGDRRKDCRENASLSGSAILQVNNHPDAHQIDLQNYKAPTISDKVLGDVGMLTRLHRDVNNGVAIHEKAFSSVVISPVEAPSPTFTFDVSCEDGIQLYVDLNSNPSDWMESMKAGVHICHDVGNLNLQNFHQEVGRFGCSKQRNGCLLMDSHKETENGQLEDGSNPSTMMTGVQPRAAEHDGVERSLALCERKSSDNTVHNMENLSEEHEMQSSRSESDMEGQPCGSESCLRKKASVVTDSVVNIETQSRTCKFSGHSLPYDPNFSGSGHPGLYADDGIYKEPPLQQISCGPRDPNLQCGGSSVAASMTILPSPCPNSAQDQNMASSSMVNMNLYSTNQPQNTKPVHLGLSNSAQFHEDVHQMRPFQTIDQSQYASSSPCMSSHSIDVGDHRREVETENATTSILTKSSGNVTEAQTKLARSRRKRRSFFPIRRYRSPDVLNLSNSMVTENDGLVNSHEVNREFIELQKKDASLYPSSNGGSLDSAGPRQNCSDHYFLTHSNKLGVDLSRSQATPDVVFLGGSKAADAKESAEYLNFGELMEKPWRKPAYVETNGEIKRKRLSDSVEDQNQSVNPELKILGTSKQFAGEVRCSRRRSSRLVTK